MKRIMSVPDESLARRILATVPYADRFPAGRLRPPVGILPGAVRTLKELHLLLAPDSRSLPGVALGPLAEWIERVIGDAALAAGIRIAAGEAASYVEGCLRTYELVGARLAQALSVSGEEEPV